MKRGLVIVVLASLMMSSAMGQDEIIPPKRAAAAKVGAVAGFTTSWLFLDAGPINTFLSGAGAGPLKTSGVFMMGGSGAAYIMVVKNLRVGGAGTSGSISSSLLGSDGVRRDAKLKAGYGAVSIEYVLQIVPHLDLVGGLSIGSGGIDLELRKDNGAQASWTGEQSSLKDTPISTTGNSLRTLQGSFFIYSPSVNIEWAILGWAGVRVGVSYMGMTSPSWKVDGNYALSNVPSDVSGKGWMLNGALIIGTL